MYGYNPKCFCKSQLHSTIITAYMSVEFSRNAFAKGLLQIFSCVTCEVRDDLQAVYCLSYCSTISSIAETLFTQ